MYRCFNIIKNKYKCVLEIFISFGLYTKSRKMFWLLLSGTLLVLILWYGYIKPYSYWKNIGVSQTFPFPVLGDIWPTFFKTKSVIDWMNWIYYKYPESKYIGMYQFYSPVLVIRDPEIIKQIAVRDFDFFTDHTNFAGVDEQTDPLWCKNLFALTGQRWRDMRIVLSASFTSSKMKIMYDLISQEAKKFVDFHVRQDRDLIEIDMKDTVTRYTTDVIASTSFGIKVDSLENPDNDFYKMGKVVTDFSGFTTMLKFMAAMICPRILEILDIGFLPKNARDFFAKIVDETIEARKKHNVVRPDMINLLMEATEGVMTEGDKNVADSGFAVVSESVDITKGRKKNMNLDNIDIAAQAMIFFFAGFDTVSSAMCYASHELAVNTDVQEQLRKEIRKVGRKIDGNPSYEDILGMKYLDMVVSETLRKWPITHTTDRVCVKPYILQPATTGEPAITFKPYNEVKIPIFNIHRDPKYYENPEKFDPERFSDGNKIKIQPYTYMPFGVGPRACIGSRFALLEIKTLLFHLLDKFEIVPTEKTQIPYMLNKDAVSLTPTGGFPLGFRRV